MIPTIYPIPAIISVSPGPLSRSILANAFVMGLSLESRVSSTTFLI